MDPELLSLDDLPAEARQAIDDTERQIAEIRDEATRQADELRARAEQAASELEGQADAEVRERQMALLRLLRPMQDTYARQGRLDEALAIRDRVRNLRATLLQAETDPGSLSHLREPRPGTEYLYDVTGT